MSNKCKIGAAFMLMAFMALICAPCVSAQSLVIDNQSFSAVGDTVTFTVGIENAPNAVGSFGFIINYDGTVLDYDSFTRGDLVAGFPVCELNAIDDDNVGTDTLKMGGLNWSGGVAAGSSGAVVQVTFNILRGEPATLSLDNLTDDMVGWPVQNGAFEVIIPHSPVLQAIANQTVTAEETLSFTVAATDADGDAITYSVTGLPADAVLDPDTGEVNWTPGLADVGHYTASITATDATLLSESTSVEITVEAPPEPHAPVLAAIGNKTVRTGETLSFTVVATDEDGDTMTCSAAGLPDGAALDPDLGDFNWTPAAEQAGQSYSVTITAEDNTGLSDSETITVEVLSEAMAISNQVCTGAVGEEVTFTISVNRSPVLVNSFGFEVTYDENILEYKPPVNSGDLKGDLTQGFFVLNVSNPPAPDTLIVAGFTSDNTIAEGGSGSIVKLTFIVKSCEPTELTIANLDDDMLGWSTSAGQLKVAPTIVCPGYIEVEAEGPAGAAADNAALATFLGSVTAMDNLGNALVPADNAPAVFGLGSTDVTFTAANTDGIESSCTATVNVVDTTPPAITCPAGITVEEDVYGSGGAAVAGNAEIQAFLNGAAATDAVDGVLTVEVDPLLPAVFAIGDTMVTFSATDSRGNMKSCTAIVTVTVKADSTPPVITCPFDITVEAEGSGGVLVSGSSVVQSFLSGATAIDAVDGVVPVVNNASGVFVTGTTTPVTFSATDNSGNTNYCTATVSVVDTRPPVITCPAGGILTLEAEGPGGVPASRSAIQTFLNEATAMDKVDGLVAVINDAPAAFAPGTTTVTFSATDITGNSNHCTAAVSVVDTTPPVINCPAAGGITVEAGGPNGVSRSNAEIQNFLNGATATDEVDVLVAVTNDAPSVFGLGATLVTFSAIDNSGNPDSCTSIVVVDDTTGPVINCPANIAVEAEGPNGVSASNAEIQDFLNGVTATDAVDGSAVTIENDAPAVFGLGKTEVNFAATDSRLNLNSCKASVTVVDTTKPEVSVVGGEHHSATSGTKVTLQASATDLCDPDLTYTWTENGNVLSVEPSFEYMFAAGEHALVLTVRDDSGNDRVSNVTVTVTAPASTSIGGLGWGLWGGYYPGFPYQPSLDLYMSFNDQLYNFQQSWTQIWNLQQPFWTTQQSWWY